MRIASVNKLLTVLIGSLLMASCGVSQNVLNQVEDDVYFSKKQQANGKDVYVPEVDVNEIMKNNPPQYGNGKPNETPTEIPQSYQGYDNTNPNAAAGYQKYLESQQGSNNYQTSSNNNNGGNILTSPQPQYNQNQYYDNQLYGNNPYVNSYNWNTGNYSPFWGSSYYTPSFNMGWNTYSGVGFGWSFGRRYRNNRFWFYNDPFYSWNGYNNFCNPYFNNYWGYSPYNGFNPYWGNPYAWGGYYGWNNWNPYYYYPSTGNHSDNSNSTPRVQTPRNDAGSSMPRTGNIAQQPNTGTSGQTPVTPLPSGQRAAMPRTNQGQLVNQNGQQIYVAPEQYRQTAPRTYESYTPSVNQGNTYRQVVPPTAPAPVAPQQPTYAPQAPQPQQSAPAPVAPPRTYPSAPSMGGGSPSMGGGRSGGGGNVGGGGGGRVSMPRPR